MQLKTINGVDQFTFCCLQWSPYLMGDVKGKTSEEIWNGDGAKEFEAALFDDPTNIATAEFAQLSS